jgi:ATP-dependent RNA helicase DDX49/DBP8
MKLFSSSGKKRKRPTKQQVATHTSSSPSSSPSSSSSSSASASESDYSDNDNEDNEPTDTTNETITDTTPAIPRTFTELGITNWLVRACNSLGITKPTPVQANCIPPILQGKNVLGAAQTGSGKTAAFLLPVLQRLSEDPYGIYALILTPTRELAFQISQQVEAFGAPLPVRQCTVVGGVDMTRQSTELDRAPHVVVATPGRLADLIQGSRPPRLSRVKFLILDEADRLFDRSFAPDLAVIFSKLPEQRQTLLFSATMDKNIRAMEEMGGPQLHKWKATETAVAVETLDQRYLFMPAMVKMAYLYRLLDLIGPPSKKKRRSSSSGGRKNKGYNDRYDEPGQDDQEARDRAGLPPRTRSMIIFVHRCTDCQLLYETLLQLEFNVVCLHSQLSQRRRLAALGKFKDSIATILVATDVAARGLDIPEVGAVINYDIPRAIESYVHRVGRTARAGRSGLSVAMITQYDVDLITAIETHVGVKMKAIEYVQEEDVIPILNRVSTASRTAKLNMSQSGFDDQMMKHRRRNKKTRKRSHKYVER